MIKINQCVCEPYSSVWSHLFIEDEPLNIPRIWNQQPFNINNLYIFYHIALADFKREWKSNWNVCVCVCSGIILPMYVNNGYLTFDINYGNFVYSPSFLFLSLHPYSILLWHTHKHAYTLHIRTQTHRYR